jgi:hypothetical protein
VHLRTTEAEEMILHRLISDNDGHWFVIRAGDEEQFDAYVQAMEDCTELPDWEPVAEVDGPHNIYFHTWMTR